MEEFDSKCFMIESRCILNHTNRTPNDSIVCAMLLNWHALYMIDCSLCDGWIDPGISAWECIYAGMPRLASAGIAKRNKCNGVDSNAIG